MSAGVFVAMAGLAQAQTSDDPFVVPAGRILVEVDVYETSGQGTDTLNVMPVLVTYGLNARTDIGVGFDGYYHERTKMAGVTTTTHDWGDVTLRCKYSLWGHDNAGTQTGETAFALLPYVKVPLGLGDSGSDQTEGGLILPFAVTLPVDWSLVIMTGFDAVADSTDTGYDFQWVESLVLSRTFSGKISGYLEFYSVLPTEAGLDWSAQVNVGVYYFFTPDFYFDCGCNFGVTPAAPDVEPFIGLTYLY
ncbi:MAG: transporter [Opitutaceae bacterium]|jgi:hypothetical protein